MRKDQESARGGEKERRLNGTDLSRNKGPRELRYIYWKNALIHAINGSLASSGQPIQQQTNQPSYQGTRTRHVQPGAVHLGGRRELPHTAQLDGWAGRTVRSGGGRLEQEIMQWNSV